MTAIVRAAVVIWLIAAGARASHVWQRRAYLVGAILIAIVWLAVELAIGFRDREDPLGIQDVIYVAVGALWTVQALGLPLPIARRIGFGLRSPAWEFDVRLSSLMNRFRRLGRDYSARAGDLSQARWRERFLQESGRLVQEISSLATPDEAWFAYRDDLTTLCQLYIDDVRVPGDPDRADAIMTAEQDLALRRGVLRRAYLQRADSLLGRHSRDDSA